MTVVPFIDLIGYHTKLVADDDVPISEPKCRSFVARMLSISMVGVPGSAKAVSATDWMELDRAEPFFHVTGFQTLAAVAESMVMLCTGVAPAASLHKSRRRTFAETADEVRIQKVTF
jgi:hypothetical protein